VSSAGGIFREAARYIGARIPDGGARGDLRGGLPGGGAAGRVVYSASVGDPAFRPAPGKKTGSTRRRKFSEGVWKWRKLIRSSSVSIEGNAKNGPCQKGREKDLSGVSAANPKSRLVNMLSINIVEGQLTLSPFTQKK